MIDRKQIRRGPDLAATAALCLFGLALTPGHFQSIDGMLMFEQARSIWHHGSLLFDEPLLWDKPYPTSFYGLGLSLLYVPGLALSSGLEPLVHQSDGFLDAGRLYVDPVFAVVGGAVQVGVMAATGYVVLRFCREMGLSAGLPYWGFALFGLGSPALAYASADFSQPLTGLCSAAALLAATRHRRAPTGRALLVSSAALFYAVLTRPVDGAVLLPAVLLAGAPLADRPATRRWTFALATAFGMAIAISLAVNYARFGAVFHNEYARLGVHFVVPTEGLLGLLVSPARGMLWAFPAIVLVPLGFRALWRRPTERATALALCGFSVALLLIAASWSTWWGGVAWGPRLVVPIIPLLAVMAACGLAELDRRPRFVAGALCVAVGLLFSLPGALTDIHGGYAALVKSSSNFAWQSHPGIGGWRTVTHLLATGPFDRTAIDVHWLRIVASVGAPVLVIPAVLLGVAAALVIGVVVVERSRAGHRSR